MYRECSGKSDQGSVVFIPDLVTEGRCNFSMCVVNMGLFSNRVVPWHPNENEGAEERYANCGSLI